MSFITLGYSDLYFSENDCRMKINGDMRLIPEKYKGEIQDIRQSVDEHINTYPQAQEFSITYQTQRFRVASSVGVSGRVSILRKVGNRVYQWRALQFPGQYLKNLLSTTKKNSIDRGGIILISGKADSGKTTTSHALINEILTRKSWFCQTIEDPVETLLPSHYENGATVHQLECLSKDFHSVLKIALRSNCDVLFVGEIRDRDGAALALQAAQSGAIVIATLHASDLITCIQRFIDILNGYQNGFDLVADAFRAAIWQSLEKRPGMSNRTLKTSALFASERVRKLIYSQKLSDLSTEIEKQETRARKNLPLRD